MRSPKGGWSSSTTTWTCRAMKPTTTPGDSDGPSREPWPKLKAVQHQREAGPRCAEKFPVSGDQRPRSHKLIQRRMIWQFTQSPVTEPGISGDRVWESSVMPPNVPHPMRPRPFGGRGLSGLSVPGVDP